MSDSILTTTKKILGIDESYTAFDVDIIMHINSVFTTLSQLGIGPPTGFVIEDATPEWDEFLGVEADIYSSVKTYVYLRVRMLFDPPGTSYHIAAIEKQIQELEWRLTARRDMDTWVDPTMPVEDDNELVFEGGNP